MAASPRMDEREVGALWRAYRRKRTQERRNRLLEHYLPLVAHLARRLWARLPEGVELDDLASAGVFGLLDAIDHFDAGRGVKFETYCQPRVRGAMLDELRKLDWAPRLVRQREALLKAAGAELERKLGRKATVAELARHLQLSVADVERMQRETVPVNMISLNKKWFETDGQKDVRQLDILVDKRGEHPGRRVDAADSMRLLVKSLSQQERLLVILYYHEERTMKEIGEELGLSESRVSQVHSQILERLQARLAGRVADVVPRRRSA